MRLLHKQTKQFIWINEPEELPYIIISHRWYGAETTLQEFERQKDLPADGWSAGVAKVMASCLAAMSSPEDYIWIDTCCIDKTSSAELQEAINSMFNWYHKSAHCLVYLDDVYELVDFAQSLWFTRGWTLQELLAPLRLTFYSSKWEELGSRNDLADAVAHITGIDRVCFGNYEAILKRPVAVRMAWLSKRKTSRKEDLAYCMLGLFDINISMLYGEGMKAFTRLQREIIEQVDDESIFLWLPVDDQELRADTLSLLAPHPKNFTACLTGNIALITHFVREPIQVTKRGIEIQTYGTRESQFADTHLLKLNCSTIYGVPSIQLQRCQDPSARDDPKQFEWNQWRRLKSQTWQFERLARPTPQLKYFAFVVERGPTQSQLQSTAPNKHPDALSKHSRLQDEADHGQFADYLLAREDKIAQSVKRYKIFVL